MGIFSTYALTCIQWSTFFFKCDKNNWKHGCTNREKWKAIDQYPVTIFKREDCLYLVYNTEFYFCENMKVLD